MASHCLASRNSLTPVYLEDQLPLAGPWHHWHIEEVVDQGLHLGQGQQGLEVVGLHVGIDGGLGQQVASDVIDRIRPGAGLQQAAVLDIMLKICSDSSR